MTQEKSQGANGLLVIILALLAVGTLIAIGVAKISPPQVQVGRGSAPELTVQQTEAVWSGMNFPPMVEMSTDLGKHPEAPELFRYLGGFVDPIRGGLNPKGDGRSSGSVKIFLGIGRRTDPSNGVNGDLSGVATVVIVARHGRWTYFLAFDAPLLSEGSRGATAIETSVGRYFLDMSKSRWTASWIMSTIRGKGGQLPPVEAWMTIRQADRQIEWILETKYLQHHSVTGWIPLPRFPRFQ